MAVDKKGSGNLAEVVEQLKIGEMLDDGNRDSFD